MSSLSTFQRGGAQQRSGPGAGRVLGQPGWQRTGQSPPRSCRGRSQHGTARGTRVRGQQPLSILAVWQEAQGTERFGSPRVMRGQRAPRRGRGANGLSHPHGSWTPVPSTGGALAAVRKWQLSTPSLMRTQAVKGRRERAASEGVAE